MEYRAGFQKTQPCVKTVSFRKLDMEVCVDTQHWTSSLSFSYLHDRSAVSSGADIGLLIHGSLSSFFNPLLRQTPIELSRGHQWCFSGMGFKQVSHSRLLA